MDRLIYGVFVVLYLLFSLHLSYVVWVRRPWAAFPRESLTGPCIYVLLGVS